MIGLSSVVLVAGLMCGLVVRGIEKEKVFEKVVVVHVKVTGTPGPGELGKEEVHSPWGVYW